MRQFQQLILTRHVESPFPPSLKTGNFKELFSGRFLMAFLLISNNSYSKICNHVYGKKI